MTYEIEPLTKEEKKWIKDFQKLMDKCPSKRFGCYTTGDCNLAIYDKPVFDSVREESRRYEELDDVIVHQEIGTILDEVFMPFQVDGVAG